jgi:trk system potassium uptake protein
MRFNFPIIIKFLGLLLGFNGFFMLFCLPFSFYYGEGGLEGLAISAAISIIVGFSAWFLTQKIKEKELRKRDGYLVVTLGWLVMTLSGSLPYYLSGAIPVYTDAFFEAMSGFTTTGATILNDIEAMPRSLLLWRSLTQWIGGMGIIVLAVAVLPILGIGGMQLFVAEAPVLMSDKIQPRIREAAKRLWLIYIGLTVMEFLLLSMSGMTYYDALNHSFTTMATGGFSTRQASIAYYNSPLIEYIIIVFMILAGTNFTITYFGLHGRFRKAFRNDEFRFYMILLAIFTLIVTFAIIRSTGQSFEVSFRTGLFQVVSILTTTGYVTADYTAWTQFLTLLFFIMMFIGASAGSTSGGVKIVRHLILLKNTLLEFKRQLHPAAVLPVRFNRMAVSQDVTFNVLAFIMIYILIFVIGTMIMSVLGLDFITAMGATATSLGNVGPGIGGVGPMENFYNIPTVGKWVLSFFMVLGRLELFTVLLLFNPYYWRRP